MLSSVLDCGLSSVIPPSWFISLLCAHVSFEISTDKEWQNIWGTTDGRASSLEQVAWVLATQRQEQLSVIN